MHFLSKLKTLCEYLGGSYEAEPGSEPRPPSARTGLLGPGLIASWWFRALWWSFLAASILLFCGQTSKFIYIDF